MVRNIYFIAFNRYLIRKNTTNYSKSQQTTEAEAGHILYFDCKALSHGTIFLATCNAILLLVDVKLANTRFHHSLLIYSQHIKYLSLICISYKSRIALQVARKIARTV